MPCYRKTLNILKTLVTGFVALWFVFPVLVLSDNTNKPQGFDLVTMKNGDIQQGTIAIEHLSIETSFTHFAIPYHQLLELKMGISGQNKQLYDQLTTRSGEVINGKVTNSEMTMFRVLDATLPLSTDDISSISFSLRGIKPSTNINTGSTINYSDSLKTQAGDILLGRILTTDFILKDSSSMKLLDGKSIQYIDVNLDDEQKTTDVQVTLKDGEVHQGQLTSKLIKFETQYGQISKLPMSVISELRFSIADQGDIGSRKDVAHRWNEAPESLFRDRMIDGSLAPEMIIVSDGEFIRGDAKGDDDEKPPTKVTLNQFAIGVFEVTFDEYDQFCQETQQEKPSDAGWGRGKRPVINVSWNEAAAYIEWLSKKTRKNYRFPTDSEWEYAARSGTQSKYWWGTDVNLSKANCEGCRSLWDGEKTAPVGSFMANQWGLHDTAGNVFEWVEDCFHDRFSEAPNDGSAVEKADCGKRVIRGGAWSFPPKEVRSANRWRDFPSRRSDDTGFRVARDL